MIRRFKGTCRGIIAVGVACAAAILAFSNTDAVAQDRTEYHAFVSTTLSDVDFLNGRKDGPQVTLAGELGIPRPGVEKLPAVVLLHGSGGVGRTGSPTQEWTREFNRLGIATFAIDSFSGRGLVSTVMDQSQLGRLAMIVDAYRALELLAKHPRIDPKRIALMGGSRGAQSSVYASMVRFQKMYGPADQEFAGYIGMYTPCGTTYHNDEDVAAKPIRLLHGTADDYVPVAPCRQYVERLTKAGRDIRLVEYPGAYHVFDAPVFKQPLKLPAPTTRACVTEEGENGVVINSKTRQPFTYDDPCVEKGVTLAYDEAAASQAKSYVGDFLSGVFALK